MANRIGPLDQSMIGKIGNKIEETGKNAAISPDRGVRNTGAAGPDARSDTVELTTSAKLLERLEKSLETLPAVDDTRVAEIRTAIRNGDYRVDARAIADAMMRFERSTGE